MLEEFPNRFSPQEVVDPKGFGQLLWQHTALFYRDMDRYHEALGLLWALYQHMLAAQEGGRRVHKGMPLVWMSDIYVRLGFRVHAKRYLMLTLCEGAPCVRAARSQPDSTLAAYFRLVWQHGLPGW